MLAVRVPFSAENSSATRRTRFSFSKRAKFRFSSFTMPRSEERRVGKECRSRCDWSSDVCSSDLGSKSPILGGKFIRHQKDSFQFFKTGQVQIQLFHDAQIGRASCRERV